MRALAAAGAAARLLKARATGGRSLLSLHYIVTERCPNTCTYCGYRDSIGDRALAAREMSLPQVREVLREAAAMGCGRIHLTGGEPLARPDLGEIAAAAKSHGLYVGLSTSGVGLPARIDALSAVDLAFVSLDGPEEVHNLNRGKADHAAAVRAVDLLLERGKRVFTTTVLNRRNAGAIAWVLAFARERRILANFVFCNYHLDPGEKSHLPKRPEVAEDVLAPEEIGAAIARLKAAKRAGEPVGSSGAYLDYMASWPDFETSYRAETHAGVDCSAGRFYAYLMPDGRLHACGDLYWRQEGRSVLELGMRRAFETLPPIPCHSCRTGCYAEQNLVLGLDPGAGANWLKWKLKGYW